MGFLVSSYLETVGVKWPGRKKICCLLSDTLMYKPWHRPVVWNLCPRTLQDSTNIKSWITKRHKLSWYIKVNFACLCKWSYCISHSQYFPRWLWMEKPSSSSRMLPFLRLSGWERQRLDPGPGAPRPLLLQLAIWSNPSLLGRTHEPRMGLKGYQGRRYWRGHSKKARHCRASE